MFVINQECRAGMAEHVADNSIDAIVTDPPYGLSKEPNMTEVLCHWLAGDDYTHGGSGFMGNSWDSFVPGPAVWKEAIRCLKPGGYALVFAGSRTQDLMATSLRLAGFEIRDTIMWVYGSGFPKSMDVSKAIDKRGGATVGWFGPWLKSWRVENGIKQADVAALFPSKTGGKTGCVANWELGFNMPTADQFNKIVKAFDLPFKDIYEAEREVIATKTDNAVRNVAIMTGKGDYDVTKAHTDEAKAYEGYGTALKPAYEPIIVCRKPLDGTVANTVLTHGTGGLNIDGCRIAAQDDQLSQKYASVARGHPKTNAIYGQDKSPRRETPHEGGRWPANIMHDGSDGVVEMFPEGKAKFFYCAKASKADRNAGLDDFRVATSGECVKREEGADGTKSPRAGAGRTSGNANIHPTVKPTELMRWMCRLVGHPGAVIMDPFTGSGSSGRGAVLEGFGFVGFEIGEKFCEISNARILDAVLNKV